MKNLTQTIQILFLRQNPEAVIRSLYQTDGCDYISGNYGSYNIDIAETLNFSRNRDELKHIDNKSHYEWYKSIDPRLHDRSDCNIFNSLLHFTKDILIENSNDIVCEFSQLLRWRELASDFGEDLFITAYLANSDLISKRERHLFAWRPTIRTNNQMLNTIYNRGLSELHFHLFGSSLNFHIGWLSLMNDISCRKSDFESIHKSKLALPNVYFNQQCESNYVLYAKAYAIRLYLFMKLIKMDTSSNNIRNNGQIAQQDQCDDSIDNLIKNVLQSASSEDIAIFIPDLIRHTTILKQLCGRKYMGECVDYAIRTRLSERNHDERVYPNVILSGERWIMYKMFSKIYSNRKEHKSLETLFYAYLIIKSRIRYELVQLNRIQGFANFQEYQDRKCRFIKEGSIYDRLILNSAISNTFKNQHINYLEARISPKNSVEENIEMIERYDRIALSPQFTTPICAPSCYMKDDDNKITIDRDKFYYIFHFIKKPQYEVDYIKTDDNTILLKPRFHRLRNEVRRQAQAINIIRKEHCSISNRIIGIDAASSEIGVRPEIFAHAFRYLKHYSYEDPDYMIRDAKRNPLGYTYHVGEDFLDIADGLRAVDEAIKFLKLGRGDRIGHGLVLGTDPKKYYEKKGCCIVLTKLDYLDNVAWLLTQIRYYNIQVSSNLIQELENDYWRLFNDIYGNAIYGSGNISPYIYYQSWLLRGDDPCDENSVANIHKSPLTFWERCSLNEGAMFDSARKIEDAAKLYIRYHYDPSVKKRGAISEEFKVSSSYIKLMEQLQAAMRTEIAEMHIAIETNPTSNIKIGNFDKYIEHPITKFYNAELEIDHSKLQECSQISVSINTDDLGVFDTNLENEYALMAIALEKEKDEDGNPKYCSRQIYNWLESIRQMGEEQQFIRLYD